MWRSAYSADAFSIISAILIFLAFVVITLGITYWAAQHTRTTKDFYAAGGGVSGFHNVLLLEPMSVMGPARYSDRAPFYFAAQLQVHIWMGALLAGVLLLVALAMKLLGTNHELVTATAASAPRAVGISGSADHFCVSVSKAQILFSGYQPPLPLSGRRNPPIT